MNARPAPPREAAPCVVLDTNVWIDILIFDDPATRPIHAALEAGALASIIDPRCVGELTRVLDYPQFVPYVIDKAATLGRVARLTTMFGHAAGDAMSVNVHTTTATTQPVRPLPLCRDRDDQKFLELAHAAGAQWLVSKDRALLKMARRIARDFGFRIAEPAPFVAACVATLLASPAQQSAPWRTACEPAALDAASSASCATRGDAMAAAPLSYNRLF